MRANCLAAACLTIALFTPISPAFAQTSGQTPQRAFAPLDVFNLEWVSDPRLSADGRQIVFLRNHLDLMNDRRRSTIWLSDLKGEDIQPLTTGDRNDRGAQFSPSGKEVAFVSGGQIYLRYLNSGRELALTRETNSVGNFTASGCSAGTGRP